ncbi:ABC transporter ATP-binding protein [Phenylobacterium sp.]|jgi:peptide/nickel transport system ATP-binding protein|uniref:ABC transporter ATP-binding protein n=1 Tax=Phenylobacterium sp. TaxID=1871053 RepID=UPI002F418559
MAGELLNIEGLTIRAESGPVLLQDFSLTLRSGEFAALVGESGSGKTMASRAILGLLPPGVRRTGGKLEFQGRDIGALSHPELRRIRGSEIGMVFQEPMVSLNPAMRIGTQLEEGLKLHRAMTAVERREICLAMLERVRVADPARCLASYPHEFSGGMRQRIMLASVMMLKPKLLIADEPTTALDTLAQREVLDVMAELAAEAQTAVILITHNLGLVARYAERAVVLEKGRTVEQGPAALVLSQPADPYTQRLVDSLPQRTPRGRGAPKGELLSVKDLKVAYRRRGETTDFQALAGVNITVAPSEMVAVVGGSGCGKTTLGRAVLGLNPAARGEIRFDGLDPLNLAGPDQIAFRRQTQLVFQDPYSSLDPRMRVRQVVAEPLRLLPELSKAERRARVEELLADVGLDHLADRFPHQMSGGQRQRVAIARAVVTRPRFVVADEPVSALDATIQAQVLALFEKLQSAYGFACLFITHDLGVVEQIADRVIVMRDGLVVEEGPRDAVFDRPKDPFTRELLAATPRLTATQHLRKQS